MSEPQKFGGVVRQADKELRIAYWRDYHQLTNPPYEGDAQKKKQVTDTEDFHECSTWSWIVLYVSLSSSFSQWLVDVK